MHCAFAICLQDAHSSCFQALEEFRAGMTVRIVFPDGDYSDLRPHRLKNSYVVEFLPP